MKPGQWGFHEKGTPDRRLLVLSQVQDVASHAATIQPKQMCVCRGLVCGHSLSPFLSSLGFSSLLCTSKCGSWTSSIGIT